MAGPTPRRTLIVRGVVFSVVAVVAAVLLVGRGAGVFERGFSGNGEGDGARRPVEQLGAQLSFQLPDLGADAGLADVHPLGRPGEVPLLGDRDEVLQLPQLHN